MTVSEIINRLEACVILARGWCLWWWKRCRSRCPLDDVGLIWTCWRLFAVCRWKANVFKSNVAQIARDFIMMVWVMCVGLSHGQHNNNSSIRKIRIYHHHHHHLFRPAIQNSSYKYQLTASRTVRLSLPITAHSLIQMSETRHTFHIHSIGLCDRFLEPGQWGEINFGRQWIPYIYNSFSKETASFWVITLCFVQLVWMPSRSWWCNCEIFVNIKTYQTKIERELSLLIRLCSTVLT